MRGRAARRQGVLGWLGTLSGAVGIAIVAGSALLGAVITVVQRQDPGAVLGVLLVLGTIVAGLAVRTRSVRLIIPAPVFCYVPTAVIAGAINDRSVDTSKIGLIIHGGKWISSGFTAMTFATIVAIIITGLRLFLDFRARPRRSRDRRAGTEQASQPARSGPGSRQRGSRPLVKDRYPPGQGDELDGLTRPMGQIAPAPTAPIGGPADGRGSGPRRQPPGTGGYPQAPGPATGGHPQAPGSGGHPQSPGSGGHPQSPGSGGYPQTPGSGGYPQPQPQPQGSGPYPQPQPSGAPPRPQGPGPYAPQPPQPGQQGSGPYPPSAPSSGPGSGSGSGGYPPQRGLPARRD